MPANDCIGLKFTDLVNIPLVDSEIGKIFCVENVPKTWNKWKLFHIFRQFGRIDDIKFSSNHQKKNLTHAFVHMMSVADVDFVISETSKTYGEILLPQLEKPLKVQRLENNGVLESHSAVTEVDDAKNVESYIRIENVVNGTCLNENHKSIIYSERLHRHEYLPLGKQIRVEMIKPILEPLHWPLKFYVLTENVIRNDGPEISKDEFELQLKAYFKCATQVKKVTKDELLVAASRKSDELPLRCRVLQELDDQKVRIYALDSGQTLIVKLDELRVISDYLASIPARAIPCTLYGISKPTDAYARVASYILESTDRLAIRVVGYEGAVALVRAFNLNAPSKREIAKIFADEEICEYTAPRNRKVYSRETILSLRGQQGELHLVDHHEGAE